MPSFTRKASNSKFTRKPNEAPTVGEAQHVTAAISAGPFATFGVGAGGKVPPPRRILKGKLKQIKAN